MARRRSSASDETTTSEDRGTDLAEVVRENGVSEAGITSADAMIGVLSDSQAGESAPPPVPMPPPVETAEERRVATAADAVIAERGRWQARARRLIAAGRAYRHQGMRDSLWAMELHVLRGRPRISYVGRAIREKTKESQAGATYIDIFDTINSENSSLLSDTLCRAVRIAVSGSTATDPDERRREEKSATSTLRKNLDKRIGPLTNWRYVTRGQSRSSATYLLTSLGKKIFDEWPNWHARDAIPNPEDAPPTDEPDASTEPT